MPQCLRVRPRVVGQHMRAVAPPASHRWLNHFASLLDFPIRFYRVGSRRRGKDKAPAIKKPAAEFKVPDTKLMAIRQ
jgi:hypothetical protein